MPKFRPTSLMGSHGVPDGGRGSFVGFRSGCCIKLEPATGGDLLSSVVEGRLPLGDRIFATGFTEIGLPSHVDDECCRAV